MKTYISILITIIFSLSLFGADAKKGKVITYPVPESEIVYGSYKVAANGKAVHLYKALSPKFEGGEYYFCYFDFEGEVEVWVHSTKPFYEKQFDKHTANRNTKHDFGKYTGEVFPPTINVTNKSKHSITFKANKPFKAIVIRAEQKMPLVIFGNPIEKNPPKPDDPNVIYFEKGVYAPKKAITLESGQTLYIAGGAVVKAPVCVRGNNVKICGRGIISSENRERGLAGVGRIFESENVIVKDVIFKDAAGWAFSIYNSKNIVLDNIKLCLGRMLNDDAIDICNSSNVKIKNTFARAEDDIVAIKGIYASGHKLGRKTTTDTYSKDNNLPVENIFVENCIFWTDSANIFRVGFECDAPYFKNIKCKNIYVPFYSGRSKPSDYWTRAVCLVQPTNATKISDVSFENILVRSNGKDFNMLVAKPSIKKYGECKECGSIENLLVKDFKVYGTQGSFNGALCVEGEDALHKVKNVRLENINYFGKKITETSPQIQKNEFTENFKIK